MPQLPRWQLKRQINSKQELSDMNKTLVLIATLLISALSLAHAQDSGGTGLLGSYYNNQDFTSLVLTRTDPVLDFNWAAASPGAVIDPDTFSIIWSGKIRADVTGIYKIKTISDDGVQVTINDKVVIENWTAHASTENIAEFRMDAGVYYEIGIKYFEKTGSAVLKLQWAPPGTGTFTLIPTTNLYPSAISPKIGNGSGLNLSIYANRDLSSTPVQIIDPQVDHNWGAGSPHPNIAADNFLCVWEGYVLGKYTDKFTFTTNSDDGVRLYIDDLLIINNWTDHALTSNKAVHPLVAGKWHKIKMEYYENKGQAAVSLMWSSAFLTQEVIPSTQLKPHDDFDATPIAFDLPAQIASYTNPAWLEFSLSGHVKKISSPTATLVQSGGSTWYATSAHSGSPEGIEFPPGQNSTSVQIVAVPFDNTTAVSANTEIIWTAFDLRAPLYGPSDISIRPGESFKFRYQPQAGESGLKVDIDDTDAVGPVELPSTGEFIAKYSSHGTRRIRILKPDNTVIKTQAVIVPFVNFNGPTACEIGYSRAKRVSSSYMNYIDVDTLGSDAINWSNNTKDAAGQTINLLPLGHGTFYIGARLSSTGALLSKSAIDEFTIDTSARRYTRIIQRYEDGSILTQAELEMSPRVPGLTIELKTYIAGVTFGDSSTKMTINSNDFSAINNGDGIYPYQLIKIPAAYSGVCHTIMVFQAGAQVSR